MTDSSLKERIQGISTHLSRQAIELLEERSGMTPSRSGELSYGDVSIPLLGLPSKLNGELILVQVKWRELSSLRNIIRGDL